MTRLISILIALVLAYGGYHFYQYWVQVRDQDELKKQEAAAVFRPESLPGLPGELEASLRTAEQKGAAALQVWLKTYGAKVQDPRKAWIELEYAKSVARDNPAEARKVFNAVKDRTPPASPLWPQLKAMEKTFR